MLTIRAIRRFIGGWIALAGLFLALLGPLLGLLQLAARLAWGEWPTVNLAQVWEALQGDEPVAPNPEITRWVLDLPLSVSLFLIGLAIAFLAAALIPRGPQPRRV